MDWLGTVGNSGCDVAVDPLPASSLLASSSYTPKYYLALYLLSDSLASTTRCSNISAARVHREQECTRSKLSFVVSGSYELPGRSRLSRLASGIGTGTFLSITAPVTGNIRHYTSLKNLSPIKNDTHRL